MNKALKKLEKDTENTRTAPERILVASYPEDEGIDFFALWMKLVRHRKAIYTFTLLGLAVGAILAFVVEPKYSYSILVEIGVTPSDGKETSRRIENAEVTRAKIQDVYAPKELKSIMAGDGARKLYKVSASIPARKGNLIKISARAPEKEGAVLSSFLERIAKHVVEDHDRIIKPLVMKLQARLQEEQVALSKLEEPIFLHAKKGIFEQKIQSNNEKLKELEGKREVIKIKLQKLSDLEDLLKEEVTQLEESLKAMKTMRQKALTEVNTETRAMTMLMIDNEVRRDQNRLMEIRERLSTALPAQRKALQNQLAAIDGKRALIEKDIKNLQAQLKKLEAENAFAIREKKQKITFLKGRLASIHRTRALSQPQRSLKPVGIRPRMFISLGLFAGLALGIALVLLREFLTRTKAEMETA